MVKKAKVFKPGDYVFAKVKGYPAWPAKVTTINGKKYSIYFFGTGEIGNLPANDLFDYFENKKQFLAKAIKRRDYNEGLSQIEVEITGQGISSNGQGEPSSQNTSQQEDGDITAEDTSQNITSTEDDKTTDDSTLEAGKESERMEVDGGSAKPSETGNTTSGEPAAEDTASAEHPATIQPPSGSKETSETAASEAEKSSPARGRITIKITKTPAPAAQKSPRRSLKQEPVTPKLEPKTPQPETISRSGRKIKPKRYLDEDAEDALDSPKPGGKKAKLLNSSSATEEGHNEAEDQQLSEQNAASEAAKSKDAPGATEKRSKKSVAQNGETVKRIGDRYNLVSASDLENIQEPLSHPSEEGASKKVNILLCLLPTGKFVGIKLFQNRPESFGSPAARQIWENTTAKNSLRLKKQLENDEIKPDSISTQLETDLNLSEEEITSLKKERELEISRNRLSFFRVENKLLDLENRIKCALSFNTPEVQLCLDLLKEMSELEVRHIMLLKHPGLVETVKRVRRYVGNKKQWTLNDQEELDFDQKAHLVRKRAEHCFNNFKSLFTLEEGKSFWESFSDLVHRFKKCTTGLTEMEVLDLMEEPSGMSKPGFMTMRAVTEELVKEDGKSGDESADSNKDKASTHVSSTKTPEVANKSQKKEKAK